MYASTLHRRIEAEWLPRYLSDYGYEAGGYITPTPGVAESDAEWFLRALDEGVVELLPKARLKLPGSSVKAMIFWQHSAAASPRRISLHLEGILSAGMAARLHLNFGWPVEQLAFEYPPGARLPGRRAFDVGALDGAGSLVLAGEAKKSAHELDHVLAVMRDCGSKGVHEHQPAENAVINGHRKWQGLVRCRPAVFFTFGPNEDWSIFQVAYASDGRVSFRYGERDLLSYR